MSKLLLPLEQISELHPDALVKELATDLRAAIATHGAYRPDNITRAAQHHATPAHTSASTAPNRPTPPAQRTQPRTALATTTNAAATTARAHSKPAKKATPLITEISSISTATKDNRTPAAQGKLASPAAEPSPAPSARGSSTGSHHGPPAGSNTLASPSRAESARAEGDPPGAGQRHQQVEGLAQERLALSECLLEACDPDVPTRAAALRTLTRALQERQQEVLEAQEKLLMVSQPEQVCMAPMLLLS